MATAKRKTEGQHAEDGARVAGRVRRTPRRAAARRHAAASGRDAGFSVLEVAFALTILLTALVSVSSLVGTIFKVGANSRFKQEATEIAAATLDTQVATGSTTLLGETGDTALPSVTSAGQTYLIEMEVAPYDPSTAQCASPASDGTAMLKVTIWVTWSDQKSGAAWWLSGPSSTIVSQTSLLAVPASVVDPTKGSILVSVENAAGNGVADLSVTATASTGTVETVVTTAGGCALFPNITATSSGSPTWTVSFGSISGYITEQELTSIPTQSGLSVVADATTSLSFTPTSTSLAAYDQAATVTPSYSVPQVNGGLHPALPTNINSLPLSFYSSNLTVSPYLTGSPAQVFPMSATPSYTVVVGSCGTDSAPEGSSTDGKSVTLSPGGTATPSFALVPVQIYVVNQSQSNSLVSPATLTASTSNAAGTGSDANCPSSGSAIMPTLQLGTTTATWTALHRLHGHGQRPHHSGAHHGVLVAHVHPKPAHRARVHHAEVNEPGSRLHDAVLLASCSSNCATTTTLGSSLNPSTSGATVTITATVACSPTACSAGNPSTGSGTVQFKDNGTNVGAAVSITNSGGTATAKLIISTLTVGTHPITAVYSGSGNWKTSTSSALSQVVNTAPTTTTVLSSANPATYGTSPVLTATVTCSTSGCGTPTGTVTFKNNGSSITGCVNVTLSSGSATCTLSLPNVQTNSITVAYTATTNYGSSNSGTLSQVVNTASTTTVLSSVPNPNAYGTSAVITATVTCSATGCGTPTGTVTFKNNGTNITGCVSVAVSSGTATCTLSGLNGGTYSVTAAYTATANYGSSNSGTLTQSVTAASTTTALSSSANPSTYNSSVTLTATVTPASGAPAVGSVTFYDTTTSLGTAAVNGSGVATLATSSLTIGPHSLSAVFTPTNANNFGSSTSTTLSDTVNAPGGSSYVLVGLPYGVWHLNATYSTYSSGVATIKVVITVTASGITVTTGSTYVSLLSSGATAPIVTVYVK